MFGLTDWSLMEAIVSQLNSLIARGDLFEQRVAALVRAHAATGIVCGHFHRAEIHEKFGIVYANCGDWLESCTAIAEAADGCLQIIHWKNPVAAPSPHEFSFEARTVSTVGA